MAKATKRQEEYTVTLEMTRSEAETLLQITNKIGGSPSSSARKFTDAIGNALYEEGVSPANHKVGTSSLYFEDFA